MAKTFPLANSLHATPLAAPPLAATPATPWKAALSRLGGLVRQPFGALAEAIRLRRGLAMLDRLSERELADLGVPRELVAQARGRRRRADAGHFGA